MFLIARVAAAVGLKATNALAEVVQHSGWPV